MIKFVGDVGHARERRQPFGFTRVAFGSEDFAQQAGYELGGEASPTAANFFNYWMRIDGHSAAICGWDC